jgi:hypothetical protein
MAEKAIHQGGQFTPGEQGRGAASQIKGVKGGKAVFIKKGLPAQPIHPFRDKRKGGHRIKIAIGAFCPTKWDVDIEAGIFAVTYHQLVQMLFYHNETLMSQRDTKNDENNPPSPPFNKVGIYVFSQERESNCN